MTKRDDRVSLVDMLVYAEEAVDTLGGYAWLFPLCL